MYRLHHKEKFRCTPQVFMKLSTGDFSDYAKYAPNIVKIDVLSRVPDSEGIENVTVRVFAESWLPPIMRNIVKDSDMNWKEHYRIDMNKCAFDWKVETPMFTKLINCSGNTSCIAIENGCETTISGSIDIQTSKMPGLPPPLARSLAGIIEPFIAKMVLLNLKKYFENIRKTMYTNN